MSNFVKGTSEALREINAESEVLRRKAYAFYDVSRVEQFASENGLGNEVCFVPLFSLDTDAAVVCIVETSVDTDSCLFKQLELLLDEYELENESFFWFFSDSVVVDWDNNLAYAVNHHGEQDYILGDGEILGRKYILEGIERSELSELVDKLGFVNNPEKALPSWFPEFDGWIKKSCGFEYGLNGGTSPSEVLAQHDGQLIFKLASTNMFGVDFCVLEREREGLC